MAVATAEQAIAEHKAVEAKASRAVHGAFGALKVGTVLWRRVQFYKQGGVMPRPMIDPLLVERPAERKGYVFRINVPIEGSCIWEPTIVGAMFIGNKGCGTDPKGLVAITAHRPHKNWTHAIVTAIHPSGKVVFVKFDDDDDLDAYLVWMSRYAMYTQEHRDDDPEERQGILNLQYQHMCPEGERAVSNA